MNKTVTIISALAFTLAIGISPLSSVQAQNRENSEISIQDLPKISKSSEMGNFHASFSGQNISSEFLINHLSDWLGTDHYHTFKFVANSIDDLGFKRSSYQHYYKGVKVADELMFIHEKDGKVTYVNGELINNIDVLISQPLFQEEVKKIILNDIKNVKTNFGEFETVISKVLVEDRIQLNYATKVQASALGSFKAFDYYIDNSTKTIVKKLSKIYDYNPELKVQINFPVKNIRNQLDYSPLFVDAPSTSATFYKGNQSITVDSFNGLFRLKDNARNIHTRNGAGWDGSANLAANELTGTITEITSSTANFTANTTKAPVEAHWAMEKAKDYYIARHNRNSYDGNGSAIKNYYQINFNADPTTGAPQSPVSGNNAAAFDVTQQGFNVVGMIYGDGTYQGNTTVFNPFVGVDVAGHEYSHLMVSRTANLAYVGESGALNESFADMFGAAIEFYANVNPNWTIGEGLVQTAYQPQLGTFLRSMSAPKTTPTAYSPVSPPIPQPDTYQGQYWVSTAATDPDHGGVHHNSGVGNKWFYLLTVGGSGTKENGQPYNVTGITIQKAEKIAYRTLATYLTANSQYINAYTSSKQAAIDLYGAGSNELQQVENAWCAVGLGNCANLLSVNDVVKSELENIKIYPNPVSNGQFTIEFGIRGHAMYEIYDFSGKIIKTSEKLEKGINKVDVTGITSGVYLVKINAEGNTISKKIVVK